MIVNSLIPEKGYGYLQNGIIKCIFVIIIWGVRDRALWYMPVNIDYIMQIHP